MSMSPKVLVFFFVFCCYCLSGHATESEFYGKPFTPENVREVVSAKGADAVYKYVGNSPVLQARIQREITSGDKNWLDIFLLLRQHPESEWGGQLDLFLAYAVTNNAEYSLNIIKQYQITYQDYFRDNFLPAYAILICGNVYEDWILGSGAVNEDDLATSAHEALCEREAALNMIEDVRLSETRDACRESVVRKRSFWAKYCKKK